MSKVKIIVALIFLVLFIKPAFAATTIMRPNEVDFIGYEGTFNDEDVTAILNTSGTVFTDGQYANVNSSNNVYETTPGSSPNDEFQRYEITLPVSISDVNYVYIKCEVSDDTTPTDALQLYLWNFGTSAWVLGQSIATTATDTNISTNITSSNSSSYISGNLVNTVCLGNGASAGTIEVDNVEATVSYNTPPQWSNNQTNPASGATYRPGGSYQFNITWTDDAGVSDVVLQFNGNNYSYLGGQVTNSSNVYHKTFTDLKANTTGWNYKWYANDTANQWNNTSTLNYIIAKNTSAYLFLALNGTQGNVSYDQNKVANFTAWLNVSDLTINLTSDYDGWGDPKTSSTSSIINYTTLSTTNDLWNLTAYWWGNENYTANNNRTYFFNVTPINVLWNQSSLDLETVDAGDPIVISSIKNASVESTGSNANVNIYTISNNASSFLTVTPTSIGSMGNGQKQEIQFECNPVYGQTPNYYEATFKVNSTEYTTGNNIAIGCTVKGAPQYSSISFNASEPVTPESVIEHITSWNMQNNIGFLDYYWFEWNATNATPDGECGELGFQNVSQGSFPPSSTASWANITMQLPPQCNDTYIAWYQTANGSSTKVTAQGYLVDRYGWLNVTLDTPTPGQLTEIDRYNTFWMNATIKCVGTPSQPCGSVNAYARRNSTGPNPDTTISTIVGQQPFWTPNANPYSCGPMPSGSECKVNWTVNATGAVNSIWALDVRAVSSPTKAQPNDSADTFIEIRENQAPQWSNNLTSIASNSQYNPSNNYGFQINWTDPDNGIGGVSQGFFFTNLTGSNITFNKSSSPAVTNNTVGIYWINFTSIGAGTYFFQWKANDTSNLFNSSDTWIYTIDKNTTNAVNLYLNGTLNSNRNYIYPEAVNATGASPLSQSDITIKLFRNGSQVASGQTATETIVLGNNTYEYKVNATAGQNYSANDTGIAFYVFVDKGATNISLFLNGTQGDRAYSQVEVANFTAKVNVSDGLTINLTSNYTGFVQQNSSSSTIYNYTTLSTTGNWWNLTAWTNGNANLTGSSQTYYFNVTPVNVLWNQSTLDLGTLRSGADVGTKNATVQSTGSNTNINVVESSDQCNCFSVTPTGPYSLGSGQEQEEQFSAAPQTGLTNGTTYQGTYLVNSTQDPSTDQITISFIYRAENYWNQSTLSIGEVNQSLSSSKNVTVQSSGDTSSVTISTISGNGTFITATPTSLGVVQNGQNKQIQMTCAPSGSQTLGYYERIFNVSSAENPGRTITVSCTVVLYDGVPRFRNIGLNATEIVPGDPILLYGEGEDAIALWQAILSTNESGSWQNFTGGGVGTQLTIYNYSGITNPSSTQLAYSGQVSNFPHTSLDGGTEVNNGNYTALSSSDDSIAYEKSTVTQYGMQRFNFSVSESSINNITVLWEGYARDSNGLSALNVSLFVWNYTSSSWKYIGSVLSTSDQTITKNWATSSEINNVLSNGRLHILAELKNLQVGDCGGIPDSQICPTLYTDFVKLEVNSTTSGSSLYGSPANLNNVSNTYTWSNFTWKNSSYQNKTIAWKIYYKDNASQYNGSSENTFYTGGVIKDEVTSPCSSSYNAVNDKCNAAVRENNTKSITFHYFNPFSSAASAFNGVVHLKYAASTHPRTSQANTEIPKTASCSGNTIIMKTVTINSCTGMSCSENSGDVTLSNATVGTGQDASITYELEFCQGTAGITYDIANSLKTPITGKFITDSFVTMHVNPKSVWNNTTAAEIWSSPAIGNINNDPVFDVITSDMSGSVYAFNGSSGEKLWEYSPGSEEEIWGSPIITCLVNPCESDDIVVIIGIGNNVTVLNGTSGSKIWSNVTGSYVSSTPGVVDVNGDNLLDVVIGSMDFYVYALNSTNGFKLWDYRTDGGIWTSSPIITDVDGDAQDEVIIGSLDANIYSLSASSGSKEWNKSVNAPNAYLQGGIEGSAAVGNINEDPFQEVVFGSYNGSLYALNGTNGNIIWQFNVENSWIVSSPLLVDLDGDSVYEVVFGSHSPDGRAYAINGSTGQQIWNVSLKGHADSPAASADIDGDGYKDVVVGSSNYSLYAISGLDGALMWTENQGGYISGATALADIDGDNRADIVTVTTNGKVIVLDPPGAMFGGNERRTNAIDLSPPVYSKEGFAVSPSGLFIHSFWRDGISRIVKAYVKENSTGNWTTHHIDVYGVQLWVNTTIGNLQKDRTVSFSVTTEDEYGNKNTYSASFTSSITTTTEIKPVCGNGVCEFGESIQNCPQDCPTITTTPQPTPTFPIPIDILPLVIGVVLIALIVLAFLVL